MVFMETCLTLLTSGDVLGGMLCPFSTAMTFSGFNYLYVFAFMIMEIAVYMKTQNLTAVGVIGILTGTMFTQILPPEALMIAYIIMAASFAALLFRVLKTR